MSPPGPRRGPVAECDLVLKGGITSGVAYPGAIIALGRAFRLRNIGGTSAGAIGSAVAAAAEFRRQRGDEQGFAESLTELVDDLGTPGFTAGLLHPTPATRPLMGMLLASLEQGRSPLRRLLTILGLLLRGHAWLPALVLGCAGALAYVTIADSGLTWWATALLVATLASFAAAVSLAGCAGLLARAVTRSLGDPRNGYGMCSGMPVRRGREALAPWLDATLQRISGLDPMCPLTFEDLEQEGVRLALLTTDLSNGGPVKLPLESPGAFWFDPADMDRLLPAPVAAHLRACSTEDFESGLRMLPGMRLPVVVAARMSLSVPLLIAAIPLYGRDPRTGKPSRRHRVWFTDGAVTSNFPITFFDAWVPTRPTFGLDLRPHPQRLSTRGRAGEPRAEEMVVLPDADRDGAPAPLWRDVGGAGTFIRQLVDALMNWRDTAQSQLPGFRDRICQIHLAPDEGGLNLNMGAATISGLNERGRIAGTKLVARFDAEGRRAHMVWRYLLLMRLLQGELRTAGEKLAEVGPELREGLRAEPGLETSEAALRDLARTASDWRDGPAAIDFEPAPEPAPMPAMRAGPRA